MLLDVHIIFLAERTAKDWQRILRHLGVKQHVIEAIEMDHPHSSYERAYKGYLHWQRSNSEGATFSALTDVLDIVKKSDLRRAMERKFSVEGEYFLLYANSICVSAFSYLVFSSK